jgi:CRISPR/Cas system-associated endonuclease/helicase Cas3
MESVILLDEAQTLPQHLAVPTLAALSHLSSAYRSTVMFATATQPAFDALHDAVAKHAASGWKPLEAVPDHPRLFDGLRRVQVQWPSKDELLSWSSLASELRDAKQVLVVVNLKRHAWQLLDELHGQEGVFHLSTNLCAEHRRAVLLQVRTRLKNGETCRLISTQCVEAGVDIDFPMVFRALAPLDSIAQAAGRCNREGRMQGLGTCVVFEPQEDGGRRRCYPSHAYYQAAELTRAMLAEKAGKGLDINDPSVFRDYYRQLYDLSDPAGQRRDLAEAIQAIDFPRIAQMYRLIEQDAIQVLVPWRAKRNEFEALREEMQREGIGVRWMRRAQGLAVSIFRPKPEHPATGVLIPVKWRKGGISEQWYILEDRAGDAYDEVRGLRLPQEHQILIA